MLGIIIWAVGCIYATAQVELVVYKSKYMLELKENGKVTATYPIVLGFNPVDDKLREGDGCTPEGVFYIRDKYPHKSWTKFLWLDYPTQDSWKKHKVAKAAGKIEKDAGVGSAIGIHGVPDEDDSLIDSRTNWTLGCVSLKTAAIETIYKKVKKGTKVTIHP